ncbi:MAG: TonB family protein [Pyrinomonadaceae bacterium]|nr:TonB family protein [Pyrinomonadaceae bacterium]
MFSHLVESDLHTGELKRRGTFFLATMAAYALVLMAMGVVGVYAYEAQINDQNLELVALVPPDVEAPKPPEERQRPRVNAPPTTPNVGDQRVMSAGPNRTAPSSTSPDPTLISGKAQASTNQAPPENIPGGVRNLGLSSGPYNPNAERNSSASGTTGDKGAGIMDEPPPPASVKKSEPPKKERIPYIGPVTSQALSLPQPVYTQVAKLAGAQGPVTVEILIDETGRVISAHATSGHPLLKVESEKAAYRARFSPTLLQNQPVKAKGVITFNFILKK